MKKTGGFVYFIIGTESSKYLKLRCVRNLCTSSQLYSKPPTLGNFLLIYSSVFSTSSNSICWQRNAFWFVNRSFSVHCFCHFYCSRKNKCLPDGRCFLSSVIMQETLKEPSKYLSLLREISESTDWTTHTLKYHWGKLQGFVFTFWKLTFKMPY